MSLTSLALRFAAPLPRPENFQRYLFLGPHPDDIEIGAGATAAKLAAKGKNVCFLICTDGRYGLQNAPAGTRPEDLVSIRQEEAHRASEVLGVSDLRFLGFSDGGFYEERDLVRAIAQVIGDFQPDVIFAPDPDVTSESHRDHLLVGRAAKELACFAPYTALMEGYGTVGAPVKALAFYMTAKADRFVNTTGFFHKQLEAVRCHVSQYPEGSDDAKAIQLYLQLRAVDFGLRCLTKTAEGFRVLDALHMHALPEAGK